MSDADTTRLRDCLARYRDLIPALARIDSPVASDDPASCIERYEQCYPLLEQALWSGQVDFEPLLDCYQALFREQDALIRKAAGTGAIVDERCHFILSIPVADRPAHLRACLESIYQLCECFGYGGKASGVYQRIRVIIAEDSREPDHIRRHIELVEAYRRRGLQVTHFGQDEQYQLLQSIPEGDRKILGTMLTTRPADRFYLKGQAANRNLSYLKCLQLTEDRHRTLYYFVDSDESFCVNRDTGDGEQGVYALNYFYYIDKAFRSSDIRLLTGKMVGDPPVSPAVMAANFLDDVTAFLTELAPSTGDRACRFHGRSRHSSATGSSSAIYHDMAGLFGFENNPATFPYRCPLRGEHDHSACLRDFARRINAFFFGEHLFRKTVFCFDQGFRERTPARTVYPGNYIVDREGLKYAIPFGHLRLRMSGPTAGRLIAAEIHDRFVSINLPHLHRRTTGTDLSDSFRPGVEQADDEQQARIDLSNEFERQFFGDLMLFTTETLVAGSDVTKVFARERIERVMEDRERELLALYQQKHNAILAKNRKLRELVFHGGHWWLENPELAGALQQLQGFIDNIRFNFGEQSPAWQQIRSAGHRARRKAQLVAALMNYPAEREAWERLVSASVA